MIGPSRRLAAVCWFQYSALFFVCPIKYILQAKQPIVFRYSTSQSGLIKFLPGLTSKNHFNSLYSLKKSKAVDFQAIVREYLIGYGKVCFTEMLNATRRSKKTLKNTN